jgi:hypothetical protein
MREQIFARRRLKFNNASIEVFIQVKCPPARFRMNSQNGMNGHLFRPVVRVGVMQGAEALAQRSHGLRHFFISSVETRPHRVPAYFGTLNHFED